MQPPRIHKQDRTHSKHHYHSSKCSHRQQMYVCIQDVHGGTLDVHGALHDGDEQVRDDAQLELVHDDALVLEHDDVRQPERDDALVLERLHDDALVLERDDVLVLERLHDDALEHVLDVIRALLLLERDDCLREQEQHCVRHLCLLAHHGYHRYCVLALTHVSCCLHESAVHNLLPI